MAEHAFTKQDWHLSLYHRLTSQIAMEFNEMAEHIYYNKSVQN